jgi:hypothetical protein
LNYVSTAGATVPFSGRMAAHRLEIAILDAIRASDEVSAMILFSRNMRIRHGCPVAWISFSGDSETPQGPCFVGWILRSERKTVCTASAIHVCD